MSYTIYIANEGGKENPINLEAWKAALEKCSELTTRSVVKRNGREVYEAFLPGKRKRYLWLNPYGVVFTQNPNDEMMRVAFFLAAELNAGVYNDNFKRYSSFEDWDRKTRHERKQVAKQIQEDKAKQLKRRLLLVAWLCACFIIGWLVSEYT